MQNFSPLLTNKDNLKIYSIQEGYSLYTYCNDSKRVCLLPYLQIVASLVKQWNMIVNHSTRFHEALILVKLIN